MKSFLQFLTESDSSSEFSTGLGRLLDRLKGTKLIDPDTGLPQPLYHATNASSDFSEFDLTHAGTFGKAVYLSPDRKAVQSYLPLNKSNMNWEEYYQHPFPSVEDELRAGAVFAPHSRVITAYGKSENPFIFGEKVGYAKGRAFKDAILDRYGLKEDPRDFKTTWNHFMDNFWKQTGHDSIVYRGGPVPEIAIPNPKNVIISPNVISPKPIKSATNIRGGARRGAVSAGTLAAMATAGALIGAMSGDAEADPGFVSPEDVFTPEESEQIDATSKQTRQPARQPEIPGGARRGAVSADTLATMAGTAKEGN